MTPMAQQANAVLNALDEGRVQAFIGLYEAKLLSPQIQAMQMDHAVGYLLQEVFEMSNGEIDYWTEFFRLGAKSL